ncbi:hypothetical protein [Aquipuribacter sp. SD81]|uniref:hypothetical protein n=1 Tax=Aquipuribacter sp. SD81 TaxID=3127703 RepID=UPI003018AF3F
MSAQPPAFGQPSTFGGAPEPAPAPAVDEPAASSRKTVVIAVAAGVVALGVLGGAAALVLSGGEGDVVAAVPPAAVTSVEPSATPSLAPATPLPTAVIKGRNVFAPLIEVDTSGGTAVEGEAVVDVGAVAPAATSTATTGSSLPTGGSTAAPLPGGGLPVVEYVEVPGPTVTVTVDGEEVLVPGPTQTIEVEKIVEVAVPGHKTVSVTVEEVEQRDGNGTLVGFTYLADFRLDDEEYLDLTPGAVFGKDGQFRYVSYGPVSEELSFIYGSALFTVRVPVIRDVPAPEPTTAPTAP